MCVHCGRMKTKTLLRMHRRAQRNCGSRCRRMAEWTTRPALGSSRLFPFMKGSMGFASPLWPANQPGSWAEHTHPRTNLRPASTHTQAQQVSECQSALFASVPPPLYKPRAGERGCVRGNLRPHPRSACTLCRGRPPPPLYKPPRGCARGFNMPRLPIGTEPLSCSSATLSHFSQILGAG